MGHVRQQGQVFAPLGAPRMASVLQGTGGEDRVPAWAPCSPVGPAAEAVSCLVTTLKKKKKNEEEVGEINCNCVFHSTQYSSSS